MPTADEATCKRELTIEVPADVVRQETEKVAHAFQRQAKVPGFRPGKTPLSLVRQRFRDEIKEEVLHHLVPEYFQRRVSEEKLNIVEAPSIQDVHLELDSEQPLRFKATFDVFPSVELKEYAGLAVDRKESGVTDAEVEDELKRLQESQATYDSVEEERPLADGDYAQISLEARPAGAAEAGAAAVPEGEAKPEEGEAHAHDHEHAHAHDHQHDHGHPAKPVKRDDVLCEIGGPSTIPAFSENLRGAKSGEERVFSVTYPADTENKSLAGQTLEYKVQVSGIKKKKVPNLDDEFAKDLGGFASVDEVRQKLREQMEEARKQESDQEAKDKVLNQLVEMHDFPVPDALVEKQLKTRLERTIRQISQQGVDPSKINLDWAKIKESHREGAVRDVKAGLLLERIAEQENIEVSDEEVTKEVERILKQVRPRDAAALRARLTSDESIENIRHRLRSEKALDSVYQKANVSTVPRTEETPAS